MKKSRKHLRFPIRVKTIIMVLSFGFALAGVALGLFSASSYNHTHNKYKEIATNLSSTVALSINKSDTKALTDQVVNIYNSYDEKPTRDKEGTAMYNEYMAQIAEVKKSESYLRLQSYLKTIDDNNTDVDGVYLGYVDYENKLCVYLVYDEENEAYPAGMVDPLYEEDYPIVDNHELGFVASIYHSDLDGGTLVTAGKPIHDEQGNIICYALVDITMDAVNAEMVGRILRMALYLTGTVLLLSILGIVIVNFTLVKPVKTLQNAAKSYDVNSPSATHEKFQKLHVTTHDEFADLAENMRSMENDINNKINELSASQHMAAEMRVLATKDALTGIRNKTAYERVVQLMNERIKDGRELEFGIAVVDLNYLKIINDQYGHSNGDIALVKLTELICDIFVHSPVYRIGGDEFVVLLRNKDYHNVDMLIEEFNHRVDENKQNMDLPFYEKTSAAIGYAYFEKGQDTCVEDVFKKADKNMYVRKWEMKQEN